MTPLSPEALPGDIQYLKLPRPEELFLGRARRFRELAAGHPMGEFLEALGRLAEAQGLALGTFLSPAPEWCPAEVPLRAASHERRPDWRDGLSLLVREVRKAPWPEPAEAALLSLADAGAAELESLADGVLAGAVSPPSLAKASFVAAALQVYFTAEAARLPAEAVARTRTGCPVCGSAPVAGVVLGDDRLRYLTCSLCGSEWNLARIQCWACRSTGGISYLALSEDDGGLRAEACESCRGYLKLFYRERRPGADPLADDVASLSLDFLAAEEGWARSGVNLFLLGEGEGT